MIKLDLRGPYDEKQTLPYHRTAVALILNRTVPSLLTLQAVSVCCGQRPTNFTHVFPKNRNHQVLVGQLRLILSVVEVLLY